MIPTISPHSGRPLVQPQSVLSPNVMIVIDLPTVQDEQFLKPLSGYTGRAFADILRNCGILHSQCYITYAIKERPADGLYNHFIEFTGKGVKKTQAYEWYKDMLVKEVQRVNPNLIIALGPVALYALTGQQGIMKYRGSLLESTISRDENVGYKVVPTVNPASINAQFINRYFIEFDLKRASREQYFPDIIYKHRNVIVAPTFAEAMSFLQQCRSSAKVAFDTEVIKGELSCISFAYDSTTAMSIPFYTKGHNYYAPDQEQQLMLLITEILENERITKICQNASFDVTFMARKYGISTVNVQDTMVAMAIAYPDFPKDLGFITSTYTDIPYYKDEGKDVFKKGVTEYDERAFWGYNAKDSLVLIEAHDKLEMELMAMGKLETYEEQVRLIEPLTFMSEYGIKMDVVGMAAMSSDYADRLEYLQEQLNLVSGKILNPRSPAQLKEYFYKEKGARAITKKGSVTTDEKALKKLTTKGHSEAEIILEMRELGKAKSTYLDMKLDADNRIRCAMNAVGTKFGRLSSSKTIFGTGANMQNQPSMMKQFMLVDEGMVGYELDLSQAENRIVAYIAPDIRMIEAFEKGIDIHSRTASYIFDIPEEQVSKEKGSTSIGSGKFSQRDIGKRANHALNYGLSPKGFAEQLEIPLSEAEFVARKYMQAYPGVQKMHTWVRETVNKTRSLTNLMGRKYIFMDRIDDNLFRAAYSYTPQSTVADIINRRGVLEVYYNQETYHPIILLNQVHDSLVFQIPTNYGWEVHSQMLTKLVASLLTPLEFRGRTFVIPADVKMCTVNFGKGAGLSNYTPEHLEMTYEQNVKKK